MRGKRDFELKIDDFAHFDGFEVDDMVIIANLWQILLCFVKK